MTTKNDSSFDLHRDRPGPRKARIAEMLRVDHAGEYGAVQIYRGQRAVFEKVKGKEETARLIKQMEEGEQAHLDAFDQLLSVHKVRPTLMSPLWNAAGFALGAGTALMGEKAAMACTSAVEEVIEKHYAQQAQELEIVDPDLAATVSEFRDEELEHKHTAEAHGAEQSPFFPLLKTVIQAGCHVAIKVSEKI